MIYSLISVFLIPMSDMERFEYRLRTEDIRLCSFSYLGTMFSRIILKIGMNK